MDDINELTTVGATAMVQNVTLHYTDLCDVQST